MRIKAIANALALIATAITLAIAAPARAETYCTTYGGDYNSGWIETRSGSCHSGDGPDTGDIILLIAGIAVAGVIIGAISNATKSRVGQDGNLRWDW